MIFVTNGLSRRGMLRTGAAAGGGLLVSLSLPLRNRGSETANTGPATGFALHALIRIGNDGHIVLTMPFVETVRGTDPSIPMLIAEELEVDLPRIRLEHAPANGNPSLTGVRAACGATATRASWMPLRQAGAIARTLLVTAAALRWNVDPGACEARGGEVIHTSSARRISYGALADHAGRLPAPETVALKRPEEFKLIGRPAWRRDTPANVNVFAIDARPVGGKTATPARSPVFAAE